MEFMKMEETINDVVLIVLNEAEHLKTIGIEPGPFYSRIVGYDEFGVWFEHPNFEVIISEDKSGKPLPADEVRRERYDASVHIAWMNIATIVHFPKREGFDFPSPFERKFGFRPAEKSTKENTD